MLTKSTTNIRTARRTALLSAVLCSGLGAFGLGACSPYPDDGEFAAGIVFSGSFLSGVKSLRTLAATGKNRGPASSSAGPYTILASGGNSATAVSSTASATSPLWTDGGKRDPLAIGSAAPVYVFDGDQNCAAPADAAPYNPRLDLFDPARQYPVFSDLPEVISGNSGRAGRASTYSAIVEVVHIATPAGFACQSVKRADTVKSRAEADLKPVTGAQKEYRLLLIIDPALTAPPLPFQRGWFNQLLVPYLDMGPVPLAAGGARFATMPLYNVIAPGGMSTILRVIGGAPDEAGAKYSPICSEITVPFPGIKAGDFSTYPPTDTSAAAYPPYAEPADAKAAGAAALSACLVCLTTDDGYQCPFDNSRAGAR